MPKLNRARLKSSNNGIKNRLKAFFAYDKRQRNGIIILLTLLLVIFVGRQYIPSFVAHEPIAIAEFQKEIAQLRSIDTQLKKRSFPKKKHSVYTKPPSKEFLLNLNQSDTREWKQLKGIGSVFAKRICKYRKLLGGFYAKEQLLEVYGMDSSRYQAIEHQIVVKEQTHQLLNINRPTIKALNAHPYLSYQQARAIVKYRMQHGAYQSVADIQGIDLIEPADFRKIAPYLTAHAPSKDSVPH